VYHYDAIELRLAFKSVESYEQAEEECRQLMVDSKKVMAAGSAISGGGGGISAAMSFRPGAKKKEEGAADEDLLLDKPLSDGDYGEMAKLEALLDKVSKLKEEAIAARDGWQEATEGDTVEVE